MSYLITSACIDVMDRACTDVCPVDCIYQGNRKLYIHPDECIDCGACEEACPQGAIFLAQATPSDERRFVDDTATFFADPLPGRETALGSPGGAELVGPLGLDTPWVAGLPRTTEIQEADL